MTVTNVHQQGGRLYVVHQGVHYYLQVDVNLYEHDWVALMPVEPGVVAVHRYTPSSAWWIPTVGEKLGDATAQGATAGGPQPEQ